ncbi:MAG: hypothetical protein M1378_13430 [Bacteroidetes bacterium]|nr:hypothetical protein [Bacteroidota bacterium]
MPFRRLAGWIVVVSVIASPWLAQASGHQDSGCSRETVIERVSKTAETAIQALSVFQWMYGQTASATKGPGQDTEKGGAA